MSKVFCIGLNKTGTSSLTVALEMLGYRTLHDDYIARKAINEEFAQGKTILSSLNGYDAFADIPFDSMFRELDQAYPGSKFILTTRDRDSWVESRAEHVRRNRQRFDYSGEALFVNKAHWRHLWDMHHMAVENWYRDRPNDLLVMDLVSGDGWDKLCPFLGKPIKENTEFPRANRTNEKNSVSFLAKAAAPPFQLARALYHRWNGRYRYFDYGWYPGADS